MTKPTGIARTIITGKAKLHEREMWEWMGWGEYPHKDEGPLMEAEIGVIEVFDLENPNNPAPIREFEASNLHTQEGTQCQKK